MRTLVWLMPWYSAALTRGYAVEAGAFTRRKLRVVLQAADVRRGDHA